MSPCLEDSVSRVALRRAVCSPMAAASMVTPFVPSVGSNLVSRSNPGAWLILRPEPTGIDNWRPWGRLEAWREHGRGGVHFKFILNQECTGVDGTSPDVLIVETLVSAHTCGEFLIDTVKLKLRGPSSTSPGHSPKSSGEFSFTNVFPAIGGSVMKCNVNGRKNKTKPTIELAMRHFTCVEDSAVFMALAAAVDLSVDACQPFSNSLNCSHPSVYP
ncbi:hypothetical protein R1sor_006761 [Riccia sorocarpa]|uniref:Uncharacterized protein n=1 Tax=Riccia sorocarpa TaxID=122646 RepID=A0ABD3HSP5_9MARC